MDWTDNSSRRRAFELHLEDVEELKTNQSKRSGKRKATDFDFALEVYHEDLTEAIQSLGDEELAPAPRPIKRRAVLERTSDGLDNGGIGSSRDAEATTSAAAMSQTAQAIPIEERNDRPADGVAVPAGGGNPLCCISCGDVHSDESAARVPCGHLYCPSCLDRFFTRASTDEEVFPPQCCTQPIPLDDARRWLPAELVTRFEKKQVEFTTLKRRYCANRLCSEFIPPDKIANDRGECTACGKWTCTICKAASHKGTCSREPARRRALALAKRQGWQRCYSCKMVVELEAGCNHISEFYNISSLCSDPGYT